ncbi:RidA family protein [Streptomyces ipomoeae]|uniref:RidA family protein n=1 Tax=Streptomyces ipomoeae TaxID=103232 RepID=UPI001C66ED0F|nr:RidA family protein [Streptomyces ipomoeae]MDX2939386.1 RidA family protein [Streptomyces ipomoeae]
MTMPLYVRAVRTGDLLFISGQLPLAEAGLLHPGHVGREVTVEQAREAAALAARRCLDVAKDELGSLDAIKAVARIGGYVAAAEGFVDAPAVVDAASQVALDELGERGRHARLAMGVASLPLGACVEIEMAVQC